MQNLRSARQLGPILSVWKIMITIAHLLFFHKYRVDPVKPFQLKLIHMVGHSTVVSVSAGVTGCHARLRPVLAAGTVQMEGVVGNVHFQNVAET